jgi:large subunit ribosomal protein L25
MASTKQFQIEAAVRHEIGKSPSRRLRRKDKLPGVIYGGGKDPVSLTFEHNKMLKSLENEAFYSHILTLKTDGETERVILKALQRHPYKPRILHVDFQRVRADEKLHMNIPLHFTGEDKAPGVKGGGIISHIMSDIEVSCFPDHLPEDLEIDISDLELNQIKHLSDIKLPPGVEIVSLLHEDDKAIVSAHLPEIEEVVEVPVEVAAPSEVPAIAQKGEDESKEEK